MGTVVAAIPLLLLLALATVDEEDATAGAMDHVENDVARIVILGTAAAARTGATTTGRAVRRATNNNRCIDMVYKNNHTTSGIRVLNQCEQMTKKVGRMLGIEPMITCATGDVVKGDNNNACIALHDDVAAFNVILVPLKWKSHGVRKLCARIQLAVIRAHDVGKPRVYCTSPISNGFVTALAAARTAGMAELRHE